MAAELETVLNDVRADLDKNGAELLIDELSETTITLRLIFHDESCMDCVLPSDLLEQGIEKHLRQQGIDLGVTLIDPRTAANF